MKLSNRQWLLRHRPEAEVGPEHFELVSTPVPSLEDGEFLVRNLYLSFEPAQRGWLNDLPSYIPPVQIGEVMRAVGVGEVIESLNTEYSVGDRVQGAFGWQDYAVADGRDKRFPVSKIASDIPITYPLHIYGLTGMTAYFGLTEIGKPQEGDTLVISGAAGATGSVVGQIGKLKGCRVIGIAGDEAKSRWLVDELGFDAAIDYRNQDVASELNRLCKNSINIFYDNVGGPVLDDALANLANGARVVLCGGISSGYRGTELPPGPKNYMQLVIRRCRMEGFIVLDYTPRFPEAIAELRGWVESCAIKVKEDIADGLESCPQVLSGLFKGKNFGKQLVKI